MTKSDLIAKLSGDYALSKRVAGDILENIIKTAKTELKKSGEFSFAGLGKLVVKETKARTGINPKTLAPLKIKAGKTVRFKVSKSFKEQL